MYKKILLISLTLILLLTGLAIAKEQTFFINKIEINKTEVLTDQELAGILNLYQNREVTITELNQAVAEINQLYRQKGYLTCKAILPPQKIENGVVEIKLVEGRLGEIFVEGNNYTDEVYFLKRISLKEADLFQLQSLENDLQYFNNTNDGVQLKAELAPGKKTGTVDLYLKAAERPHTQYALFMDNAGRDQTGLYRLGFSAANNSLIGYQDRLSLFLLRAEGTVAGSVSYDFPLSIKGSRLGIGYSKNQTQIIAGDFQSVDIQGDYSEYNLSLTKPMLVEEYKKVDGFFELHVKESDTYFSGAKLLTADVKTAVVGFANQSVDEKGIWNFRNSFTRGELGEKQLFSKYNLSFVRQKSLEKGVLTTTFTGQLTTDHMLPSSEQFSIGGMATIRGYEEGRLTGDQGYCFNVEVSEQINEKLQGFIFLDHGGVFPYKGNEEEINHDDYLTSTGLGFLVNIKKNLTGKIVLGLPLELDDEPAFHFSLQTNW